MVTIFPPAITHTHTHTREHYSSSSLSSIPQRTFTSRHRRVSSLIGLFFPFAPPKRLDVLLVLVCVSRSSRDRWWALVPGQRCWWWGERLVFHTIRSSLFLYACFWSPSSVLFFFFSLRTCFDFSEPMWDLSRAPVVACGGGDRRG